MLCHVYGMLESAARDSCSDCPTPTPDQTSTGRPPKLQQSSKGTGKWLRSREQRSNTWIWPLLGLSQPGARPNVPAMRQAIQVRQQGQESKGARAKEGGANLDRVVTFTMLAQLVIETVHGSSRDIKVGSPGGLLPHTLSLVHTAAWDGNAAELLSCKLAQSHQKTMCLPPTSRPGWSPCKVGYLRGPTQKRTLFGGEHRSGSNPRRIRRRRRLQRLGDHAQGEIRDFESQPAMLCQAHGIPEAAANDSRWDDMEFAQVRTLRPRRLTRRPFDTGRSLTGHRLGRGERHARSCKESALDIHCRDYGLQKQSRPAVKLTLQVKQEAQRSKQERKGKRRRGKLRPGRDFRNAGPARSRDRGRRFPRHHSGWPTFFALMSSFTGETEFTKFVSEEIATALSRHNSRRRRIPMPASPRRRVRCNRHEARAGVVALIPCCLVRLSTAGLGPPGETVSLPGCTQRRIHSAAAPASCLDPMAFSGDK